MLAFALLAWTVLAWTMLAGPAAAVLPDEMLADPALEAQARDIGRELRCLVCQNQSIDDSNAPLARDLRILVRERLAAGDDEREVLDYVVARYGDYVLLRPPFKAGTYALWLGPAAILLLAGAGVAAFLRGRRRAGPEMPPLSEDERRRLDQLIRGEP
ncbi:cytochrome c-type biogenesis protein [Arenibaculum sp.]|uniref:cytochrome c-type biogenesis protein n=1 Tax=Arenibaculum sp. TaxID=2865862 RepID=UPI002E113DC9|nr:cytochrome c-type biogenesis protein [Arenibaculum sp.]